MVFSLLLPLCAPAFLPQVEVRERVVIGPEGDRVVEEVRDAGGWVVVGSPSAGLRTVKAPRWRVDDNGQAWIAETVAVGDSGAAVIAGKGLNNEGVAAFPGVDPQPLFDFSTLGSEAPQVALADRAPVAAALVATDMDPGSGYDYEGVLRVWDTMAGGAVDWSYTFPRTANYFGGGAAVSDDGSIVLAWKADPNTGSLLVRTFDRAGNLLASGALASGTSFHARQARLSDDGRRAYFNIGSEAVIYDTLNGVEEYRHNIGASFDAHALSGDGKRFAYGQFGYFRVYEETSPGNWTLKVHRSFAGSVYVGAVALDRDGSHCAFLVQRYSPAMDHIEVGVHDVDADVGVFLEAWDAPGTAYQLSGRDAALDDAGERAAFCSWGDSLNAVPEGLVYDVAAGVLSCSLDSPGSAYDLDLDPDGDVFVMGTKAVHANVFGNGGSIFCADAGDQNLHVLGWPVAGGALTLQVPDVGGSVVFGASRGLLPAPLPTAFGLLEIDRNALAWQSPPILVPPGGLSYPVSVPPGPGTAGRDFHLQALIVLTIGNQLTNKVSLRVHP
ncbi:MAG: hypothetical protein D6702_10805 [Planctomycetota bacterium]|nr:MAG: hypothetical protein D6702_10805 [Planctomycetota bacterium]